MPAGGDELAQRRGEIAAELGEEPRVVVGHSFGGKVALVYAREQASSLEQVWVLDAPPGLRSGDGTRGDVENVFARVGEVPLPVPGRDGIGGLAFGQQFPTAKVNTTKLAVTDTAERASRYVSAPAVRRPPSDFTSPVAQAAPKCAI